MNNNNNDYNIENIIKHLFDNIDNFIITNMQKALKNSTYKKDYEEFKQYCLKNPMKIFEAIDYIYPNIHKTNIKIHIDTLLLGFSNDEVIYTYLTKYRENLTKILNTDISIVIKGLLKYTLIQLHKYHRIYEKNKKDDLIILLEKEYNHRHNIKKNI